MNKEKELINTTNIVKNILEEHQQARNNDDYLYCMVCEKINANSVTLPFAQVMQNRKDLGLPGFETVTRSRRKIQEHYPELAGCAKVKEARKENEDNFKKFAKIVVI